MKDREVLFVTYTKVSVAFLDNLNKSAGCLSKNAFTSYFQFRIQRLYEVDDHVLRFAWMYILLGI